MNNLIKQKEAIVKQEIANTEKIIELEGINSNLKFSIEDLTNKVEELTQKVAQEKDANRKLSSKLKDGEHDHNSLQENYNKLQLKLKEKEQELSVNN